MAHPMRRNRALHCLASLGMMMACAPGFVSDESRRPQPEGRSAAEDGSPTTLLASTGGGAIPIPESLADPLRSGIAAREYWATETERGLQAPNRENDFRIWFGTEGVRVDDRDAEERTPLVELALAASATIVPIPCVEDLS